MCSFYLHEVLPSLNVKISLVAREINILNCEEVETYVKFFYHKNKIDLLNLLLYSLVLNLSLFVAHLAQQAHMATLI